MMKTKFILFAPARSGSTSLSRCLDLHPDRKVLEEPFHPSFSSWGLDRQNYQKQIKDIPSLQKACAEIFSNYEGIKVLDHQLDEELYRELLLDSEYKVIFLKRKNLLKMVVSGLIAEQTAIWQQEDFAKQGVQRYEELRAIDPEILENKLHYAKYLQGFSDGIFKAKPTNQRLQLVYEDFFVDSLERSLVNLSKVFEFLNVEMPKEVDFSQYLDSRRARVNDQAKYLLVPNLLELDRKFGSEEFGFLVDR